MRRVVGRAELAREQAGQRLHLVAPGEQRELLRVGGANLRQPLGQRREGLLPLDLDELAVAALARPRGASGCVSRAGEYCFMIPDEPLAQITPWFSGWSGLPSM